MLTFIWTFQYLESKKIILENWTISLELITMRIPELVEIYFSKELKDGGP